MEVNFFGKVCKGLQRLAKACKDLLFTVLTDFSVWNIEKQGYTKAQVLRNTDIYN